MSSKEILEQKGYCVLDIVDKDILNRLISTKYTIVALILEGAVEFEINMETIVATAGTRITFPHVSMLKTLSMSDSFHAVVLVVDDKFAFEATVGIESSLIQSLFNTPVVKVNNPQEWDMLINLVDGLNKFQHFQTPSHSLEISGALFRNLILIMCEFHETTSPRKRYGTTYSVSDTYFRSFINMLNDHIKTEHEVAYYASELKITSKYLGEICKCKSGRKAKEIISAVLIAQLKREIALSGKSLKVIAFEYGFADQSSLGKFFRKMTGVSPRLFKSQGLGQDRTYGE